MKKRPLVLTVLSFVFAVIAISFPVQIASLYGYGLLQVSAILSKISVVNVLVMMGLIANSVLFFKASHLIRYTVPALIVVTGWNNYIVGSYAHDFSMSTTFMATAAFALLCAPLLTKDVIELVKHPGKRWWLRPKRVKAQLSTVVMPYVGEELLAETFDLSETGMFILMDSCKNKKRKSTKPDWLVGDYTTLQIGLSQCVTISCEARVVRTNDGKGNYPPGVGLEFVNIDPVAKKHLQRFVNKSNFQSLDIT